MKKFNGKKMSHTQESKDTIKCPICKTSMKVLRGKLRCAELRSTHGKSKSALRMLIKHGSMKTIRKRLKKGFPDMKTA